MPEQVDAREKDQSSGTSHRVSPRRWSCRPGCAGCPAAVRAAASLTSFQLCRGEDGSGALGLSDRARSASAGQSPGLGGSSGDGECSPREAEARFGFLTSTRVPIPGYPEHRHPMLVSEYVDAEFWFWEEKEKKKKKHPTPDVKSWEFSHSPSALDLV